MDDDRDDRANPRPSALNDDLQQDRRLIMKKIQQRRRTQLQRQRMGAEHNGGTGERGGERGGGDRAPTDRAGPSRPQTVAPGEYFFEKEDEATMLLTIEEEDLRDARATHREDEQVIGGRLEDGREEGLEAMNQALTSPPVAWWAMRKQWQKRRGDMLSMVGLGSGTSAIGSGIDAAGGSNAGGDNGDPEGIDASYRSQDPAWADPDAGVVGHPMMLEDPASVGYGADAYRQNPFSSSNRRKRTPTVVFVPREVLRQRKIMQTMYIAGALSACFLFVFFLEQRKLSHYAMVKSPMSLEAYLAGEQLMAQPNDGGDNRIKLGDLGLEEFDEVHAIPQVEFGNIEVNPDDPLANEELANDPLVGDHPQHGGPPFSPNDSGLSPVIDRFSDLDRFELLMSVVVGWGVTPVDTFQNHNSPQYRALHWMAHEDTLRYVPDNDHWIKKIIQRYALAVIYYSTNGTGWSNSLFFLSSYDECNWNRKYMGYFTGAGKCEGGYVTVLALWSNNLSGALPFEVGALSTLRTFSVFDNVISVPPPESLAKLTSLNRLYLQKNSFKNVDISFLCPNNANDFKADCGRKGRVKCPCCSACGYNPKSDKGNMVERFV